MHSGVKVLPFESFRCYTYVTYIFVDNSSRLGSCYFLRLKSAVLAVFRQYNTYMKRFRVRFTAFGRIAVPSFRAGRRRVVLTFKPPSSVSFLAVDAAYFWD